MDYASASARAHFLTFVFAHFDSGALSSACRDNVFSKIVTIIFFCLRFLCFFVYLSLPLCYAPILATRYLFCWLLTCFYEEQKMLTFSLKNNRKNGNKKFAFNFIDRKLTRTSHTFIILWMSK